MPLLAVLAVEVRADAPKDKTARPVRSEVVTVKAPVKGIAMTLEPSGDAGWRLTARNEADVAASIVWDESSFVAGNQESWGRLVPGVTKLVDLDRAHPATRLAPRATLTEVIVPEKAAEIDGMDFDLRTSLDGGRIYITVARGTVKSTWTGELREDDVAPIGWWCATVDGDRRPCFRDRAGCENARKLATSSSVRIAISACAMQPTAVCYAYRFDGKHRASCWSSGGQCALVHAGAVRWGNADGDCAERR
jgi:hypothetical protein